MDWIYTFVDEDTDFQELNSSMDINSFEKTIYHTEEYYNEIKKVQEKTGHKSALITGLGQVFGKQMMFCAFDFNFLGGSLGGLVEPRKFAEATIYANENKYNGKKLPVILISSSGGSIVASIGVSIGFSSAALVVEN